MEDAPNTAYRQNYGLINVVIGAQIRAAEAGRLK